eukprot:CAMPEP_0198285610 /NCGR_PEP_ID=MMETSP1449-20131203/4858_1 /TAXON_ID=420275 /ORGANISM="Attheya septentrionalis, Strain CCMP2084" /LENGTH=2383 /DNA_ID=CAMNT_0043983085 /DNA_START=210 /DNA_END=7361 /DNA_ORIENTATION=+
MGQKKGPLHWGTKPQQPQPQLPPNGSSDSPARSGEPLNQPSPSGAPGEMLVSKLEKQSSIRSADNPAMSTPPTRTPSPLSMDKQQQPQSHHYSHFNNTGTLIPPMVQASGGQARVLLHHPQQQYPAAGQGQRQRQMQGQEGNGHVQMPSAVGPSVGGLGGAAGILTPLPTVALAAEEIWNCAPEDFERAAKWVQLLHHSIVAEADHRRGGGMDVYSPGDVFMSIQGAVLRFPAKFEERRNLLELKRRDREQHRRKRLEQKQRRRRKATEANIDNRADIVHLVNKTDSNSTKDRKVVLEKSQSEDHGELLDCSPQLKPTISQKVFDNSDALEQRLDDENDILEVRNWTGPPPHIMEVPLNDRMEEQIDACTLEKPETNNAGFDCESDLSSSEESDELDVNEEELLQWEDEKEMAWDVWEESIWAGAALSRECVGPAWRYQIRKRREWLRSGLPYRRHDMDDSQHTTSTLGMNSAATIVSRRHGSDNAGANGSVASSGSSRASTPPSLRSNHVQVNNTMKNETHPHIPQNLPANMLRFAASVGDLALPPIRQNQMNKIDEFIDDVTEQVREEQRCLIRRQLTGEAQRELVLALCCNYVEMNVNGPENGANTCGMDEEEDVILEWTIFGAHDPIASMIVSWLETARAGWPAEKLQLSKELTVDNSGSVEFAPSIVFKKKESESVSDSTDQDHMATGVHKVTNENEMNNGKGVLTRWIDLVEIGAIDWSNTLQVIRAVADLVSAGWRPPPKGANGGKVIMHLLSIAEKGVLLDPRDMRLQSDATDHEAREDRLLASSSAAEAMSALASLGAKHVIPSSVFSSSAEALCRLLAIADSFMSGKSVSELYPFGTPSDEFEEEEWSLERETFASQRESCLSDTAELLWALLAGPASAGPTTRSMFRIMDVNLSVSSAGGQALFNVNTETSLKRATFLITGGAVRSMGAALWGNPPLVKGLPSHRLFWKTFLDILGRLSSTIHVPPETTAPGKKFRPSLYADTEQIMTLRPLTEYLPEALVALFESVVAMRRLVDGELATGDGALSPTEWDSLIVALDRGIIPWLDGDYISETTNDNFMRRLLDRNEYLYRRLNSEVTAIFLQLERFLNRSAQSRSSSYNLIVDSDCLHRLHLLLLQRACPLMSTKAGESLGIAVIRSWGSIGSLPHNGSEWSKVATDMLSSVFSRYSEPGYGYYEQYVHSPMVRLEVIIALTHSDSSSKGVYSQVLSPLSLTRNLRELHLELINRKILPYIFESVSFDVDDSLHRKSVPKRKVLTVPPAWKSEGTYRSTKKINTEFNGEVILLKNIVRLLGKLFRGVSSDRGHRLRVMDELKSIAVGTSAQSQAIIQQAKECQIDHEKIAFQLCLEGVNQIHLCFQAPFSILPHTHEIIPVIIDTLFFVLRTYITPSDENVSESVYIIQNPHHRAVLAIMAFLPLARIRITHNGHMALLPEKKCSKSAPTHFLAEIHSFFDIGEGMMNETQKPRRFEDHFIAPLIHAGPSRRQSLDITERVRESRESRMGSNIDMQQIASILSFTIQSSYTSCHSQYLEAVASISSTNMLSIDEIQSKLRSVCFDTLRSLVTSGVRIHFVNDVFVNKYTTKIDHSLKTWEGERIARGKALAAYAGFVGEVYLGNNNNAVGSSTVDEPGSSISLQDIYLQLFELASSDHFFEVYNGCRGVSTLLASTGSIPIEEKNTSNSNKHDTIMNTWGHEVCKTILDRLQDLETKLVASEKLLTPLLSVLWDCFSRHKGVSLGPISGMRRYTAVVCEEICSSPQVSVYVRAIALHTGGAAIRGMSSSESQTALEEVFKSSDTDNANNDNISDFRLIVLDLLVRQYLYFSKQPSEERGVIKNIFPCTLEAVARETEDMDRFLVNENNEGVPFMGAWLCENSILTLRIGSSKTTFRGWIEIIIRSASSRTRRLLRLPFVKSLQDPEFPSVLYGSYQAAPNVDNVVESAQCIAVRRGMEENERFDEIRKRSGMASTPFPSTEKNHSRISNIQTSIPTPGDNILTAARLPINSKLVFEQRRTSVPWRKEASPAAGKKSELRSIVNVCYGPTPPVESVISWLTSVLGGSEGSIAEVKDELLSLGLSSTSLNTFFSGQTFDAARYLHVDDKLQRALSILDRTASLQTHKIAVLFVGPLDDIVGSASIDDAASTSSDLSTALYASRSSPDFIEFSDSLGTVVTNRHLRYFSGGLDTSIYASDGEFALVWMDEVEELNRNGNTVSPKSMVVFHMNTMMPLHHNNRKRHLGNDLVYIIFVDKGYEDTVGVGALGENEVEDQEMTDVTGDFGFVRIYVAPMTHGDLVRVVLRLRPGLDAGTHSSLLSFVGTVVITKGDAGDYVRQLAIRADIACRSTMEDRLGLVSNWEERLVQIKKMKRYEYLRKPGP